MLSEDAPSPGNETAVRRAARQNARNELYEAKQRQLGLMGIGWITVSCAALMAYAKGLGPSSLVLLFVYGGFVSVIASLAAAISGRWNDSYYWSALFAILAFLAIAGAMMINRSVAMAWGAVGASCGAMIGAKIPRAALLGSVASGFLAAISMLCVLFALREPFTMMIGFDLAFAVMVGVVLRPLADILRWAESRSGQHRVVLASWLALCVLIGNALVPVLAGTVR